MLNKIFLQGRLTADPELRHTPSGVAVASFRLAVDRDFKDRETGEKKADFISVVAWRQTGEFVSRYFNKGRMAIVEGRLQMRDYTDRDGNRRTASEVVADNVYFGDSRKDGEGGGFSGSSFGGSPYSPAPGGGYPTAPDVDQFAELSDDDGELPF
jgi:single-strand DNA-binding protein